MEEWTVRAIVPSLFLHVHGISHQKNSMYHHQGQEGNRTKKYKPGKSLFCKRLKYLLDKGLNIKEVLTDAHVQIRAIINTREYFRRKAADGQCVL